MNNDINDANNKWAQSIGIREETHDIKPWKFEYLYPYDSNLPKLSDQQNKMESDAGVNCKQCKNHSRHSCSEKSNIFFMFFEIFYEHYSLSRNVSLHPTISFQSA